MADSTDRRVPADWESIACVWLAWPHQEATWPGLFSKIQGFYLDWIDQIGESVPIKLLAGLNHFDECRGKISGRTHVEVVPIETNDCWIRDYGPTFVRDTDQGLLGIDWQYNAWGGKYPPWESDNAAAEQICRAADLTWESSRLCLEGGALEFDGAGHLLTTSRCLITDTRNPGWTHRLVEQELDARLGVRDVCWVDGGGLRGDDTDGHVDQLARFVSKNDLVAAVASDSADENHLGLEENYQILTKWVQEKAPHIQVHRLPIPPARYIDGTRVPESYCNFLRLGPERILMPSFGVSSDEYARGILEDLTSAEVQTIDCRDMVWGLGALHCASREQPL